MARVAALEIERLKALSGKFSGTLLQPGDMGYEEARKVWNGLIDKRPALIARCRGAADIADAIAFARAAGLEISVRGGGHNPAGRAVTDGGVMIDLAEMKGIHVDPEARTLRAQGGVTWGELNREAAAHGLAVTGGAVSTTGIAGYTLGGGLGWLMGVHGLAADNLLSVQLVTANSELLDVTERSHPDLFWALRGGGGNFGVAVSLEYQLHPLRQIVGGIIAHPFGAAGEALRFYREFTQAGVPDELMAWAGLIVASDGSGAKLAVYVICHAGDPQQAERDIAPLLRYGAPVLTQVGPMPYPAMNTLLDEGFPRGALNYWKANFLQSLDDDLIDIAVEHFDRTPSPLNGLLFEHFHGAVTRVGVTDTAVPHREEGYNLVMPSVWRDPADTAANIAWTRATYNAMRPFFRDARWLNYLDDDDRTDAVRSAYGPNYDRLIELKRRYDPGNLFHLNHNIDPAG